VNACIYTVVTRGHFRSRDKDGGHIIRSAIAKNPLLHTKLYGSVCYRTGVIVHIAPVGIFYFIAPVTLTLTLRPSHTNLTRISSRYTGCAKINFLRQGFQKLSYYIHKYIPAVYIRHRHMGGQ